MRTAVSEIAWSPISDKLLSARLAHRHGDLTVIMAYAPTDDTADTEKDDFYTLSDKTIHAVPKHDRLVIAGVFNAVSSSDRTFFKKVVGPFSSGIAYDNTMQLLSLCASTGISVSVVAFWFQCRDVRRWT